MAEQMLPGGVTVDSGRGWVVPPTGDLQQTLSALLDCANRVRDPASKGGVQNTVKLAKADIVPTDTNLADEYACFADLEAACAAFMALVNHRVHRSAKRVPADMLAQERPRLHPVPATPTRSRSGKRGRSR